MNPQSWEQEVSDGERFRFGDNWARFLKVLDNERIQHAERSLSDMLGMEKLEGKSLVDVGSGSGLFSLAARRLGAEVSSFDFDPQSVACTAELKRRHFEDDGKWTVERGSVLDRKYLADLGMFDIVYSWGVLHHTGEMWQALNNVADLVGPDGVLFIAIYNDQGPASHRWTRVKRAYVSLPGPLKWAVLLGSFVRLWGPTLVRDALRARPMRSWTSYSRQGGRGMDPWRDVVDWVGGYPFEVARPEEVFDFYRKRGFRLERLRTCGGGLGCNEFVFKRVGQTSGRQAPL